MTGKMKAMVKNKKQPAFDFEEIDIPKLGPRDVLIEVKAAAICGSDLHCYKWDQWAQGVYVNVPFIPGHECAGLVADVGGEVTLFKKGDKVAAETHIPCGTCYQCRNSIQHICQNMKLFGHTVDGCFAQYCTIPETAVYKVPDSIPWESAALMEPIGISIRPAAEAGVFAENVIVIGAGPVGQIAIASARIGGATQIIATDINEERLKLAKTMGADVTVNPTKESVPDIVRKLTNNDGIDHVIEASGSADALEEAFGYLRKGGKVSIVGNPNRPVQLNMMPTVIHKEAKVTGFHGRRMFDTWKNAEALLASKRLDVKPIITHKFPLAEFEKAFEYALAGKGCKIMLIP